MTHAKRVDGNQSEIVDGLRACGCTVQDLSGVGCGCHDLLVGKGGMNFLFEVKTRTGKLNSRQILWHAEWHGQVNYVKTLEEAIETIKEALR